MRQEAAVTILREKSLPRREDGIHTVDGLPSDKDTGDSVHSTSQEGGQAIAGEWWWENGRFSSNASPRPPLRKMSRESIR